GLKAIDIGASDGPMAHSPPCPPELMQPSKPGNCVSLPVCLSRENVATPPEGSRSNDPTWTDLPSPLMAIDVANPSMPLTSVQHPGQPSAPLPSPPLPSSVRQPSMPRSCVSAPLDMSRANTATAPLSNAAV